MADHMKKYKDADYRFSVISKLVFTGFTPTLAKQLAKEAGVNVRTVKRWYQAYTKDNHITALNPKYKGSTGVSRLIPSFDDCLKKAQEMRLADRKISVKNIIKALESENPELKGLISRSTLQRHLQKTHYGSRALNLSEQTNGRKGYGRFRKEHRLDSVQCDVKEFPKGICVDDNGAPCTPYVQICIDNFSRKVLAFKVDSVQKTLIVSDSLKQLLLTYGIPKALHIDNGAIYKNAVIKYAAKVLGIELNYCRPRKGNSKGVVERFNGTLNAIENQLRNNKEPIRLSAFIDAITQFINDYNATPHEGLGGKTPNEVFDSDVSTTLQVVPQTIIDRAFKTSSSRLVHKDKTVSINGKDYEVILDETTTVGGRAQILEDVDGNIEQMLADGRLVPIFPLQVGPNVKHEHFKKELPVPGQKVEETMQLFTAFLREKYKADGTFTSEEEFQNLIKDLLHPTFTKPTSNKTDVKRGGDKDLYNDFFLNLSMANNK